MDKIFQTYYHVNSDGIVFYVGAGNERRPHKRSGRQAAWKLASKNGYSVVIAGTWSSPEEAGEHERSLILYFRNKGHPLVNIRDGGGGRLGAEHTIQTKEKLKAARKKQPHPQLGMPMKAETKEKIGLAHRGEKSSWWGRQHSKETKAKMSKARKIQTPPFQGMSHSKETRDKMSAARKAYWENKRNQNALG